VNNESRNDEQHVPDDRFDEPAERSGPSQVCLSQARYQQTEKCRNQAIAGREEGQERCAARFAEDDAIDVRYAAATTKHNPLSPRSIIY